MKTRKEKVCLRVPLAICLVWAIILNFTTTFAESLTQTRSNFQSQEISQIPDVNIVLSEAKSEEQRQLLFQKISWAYHIWTQNKYIGLPEDRVNWTPQERYTYWIITNAMFDFELDVPKSKDQSSPKGAIKRLKELNGYCDPSKEDQMCPFEFGFDPEPKIQQIIKTIFSVLDGQNSKPIHSTLKTPLRENQAHALLVTHAGLLWDVFGFTKPGLDDAISQFQSHHPQGRIYFLVWDYDHLAEGAWFSSNRHPHYRILSSDGTHSIAFESSQITLTGGNFSECLERTWRDILEHHQSSKNLELILPMRAIYDGAIFTLNEIYSNIGEKAFFHHYLRYISEALTALRKPYKADIMMNSKKVFHFNPPSERFAVFHFVSN